MSCSSRIIEICLTKGFQKFCSLEKWEVRGKVSLVDVELGSINVKTSERCNAPTSSSQILGVNHRESKRSSCVAAPPIHRLAVLAADASVLLRFLGGPCSFRCQPRSGCH
jgi:hypothetical protein